MSVGPLYTRILDLPFGGSHPERSGAQRPHTTADSTRTRQVREGGSKNSSPADPFAAALASVTAVSPRDPVSLDPSARPSGEGAVAGSPDAGSLDVTGHVASKPGLGANAPEVTATALEATATTEPDASHPGRAATDAGLVAENPIETVKEAKGTADSGQSPRPARTATNLTEPAAPADTFAEHTSQPASASERAIELEAKTSAPKAADVSPAASTAEPSARSAAPLATNDASAMGAVTATAPTTSLGLSAAGAGRLGGAETSALDFAASLDELPRAMVRLVRGAGPGGERVAVVQLTPPELGTIRVRLGVAGDQVRATVETELASTRDVLRDLLQPFSRSLADSGLSLERFDVNVRSRLEGTAREFDLDRGGDFSQRANHEAGNGASQRGAADQGASDGRGHSAWRTLTLDVPGGLASRQSALQTGWTLSAARAGRVGLDIRV